MYCKVKKTIDLTRGLYVNVLKSVANEIKLDTYIRNALIFTIAPPQSLTPHEESRVTLRYFGVDRFMTLKSPAVSIYLSKLLQILVKKIYIQELNLQDIAVKLRPNRDR
jgi:hypothetical protein